MTPPQDATSVPFSLSVLTATNGHASKRLVADAFGSPVRDPNHSLGIAAGRVEHQQVTGLNGLADLLTHIGPKQALVHGIPKGSLPGTHYTLVTAERYTGAPGTVARTLECFDYPEGIRLLMLDYDTEPDAPVTIDTPSELVTRLPGIWPTFGWLATISASSAIRDKRTNEWLKPPKGLHVYVLATGNVARFRELLKVRLWLSDTGYCKLATPNAHTGVAAILERCLVDLTVFSPERLDYVAGAIIPKDAPFYQERPDPVVHPGHVLDLDALPEVTEDERQQYAARVAEARARLLPEQHQQIRVHITTATPDLPNAQVDREITRRLVQAERGELATDHPLYFDNGTMCTAMALTKALDGKRLADPQEPDYGKGHAVFHWRDGDWRIVSWAHGLQRTYTKALPLDDGPPPPDETDWEDLTKKATQDAKHRANGHGAWREGLLTSKTGEVKETYGNHIIALQHLAPWARECWYDLVRELPMCGTDALSDTMVGEVACALERQVRIPIRNTRLVQTALVNHCRATPRDPLQDYLASLPPWDRVPRLEAWLHDHTGAPKTAYGMDISRLWPVSMIARALTPGCQYRYVIVLEGPEDLGKSKLVKVLPGWEWYREISHGFDGKEGHMILMGAWVVELAELSSYKRTEETRLKSFITMERDDYIPKFANAPVSRPRRTIFIATHNPEADNTYLRSQTGNTRYLPIALTDIDIDAVKANREQLLAEALVYYQEHPDDWWQLSSDGQQQAATERDARRQASVYEDALKCWLDSEAKMLPTLNSKDGTPGKLIITWELIANRFLGLDTKDWKDRALQMEIGKAMGALGWVTRPQWLVPDQMKKLGLLLPAEMKGKTVRVWVQENPPADQWVTV